MDIDIILGFQGVREGAPDAVTAILNALSTIADGPGLVAIVMIVYWCVSKRAGQFTITAFLAGNLMNQFLKNIVCAYRPWIRDARIVPPESVIEGAGGYSFPSGHSTGATASLGSFAYLLWRKRRGFSIVLIVVVALIVISRLYFGVHTPQDVLFGVLLGVLSIWLTTKFFDWLDENGDKDILVAVIAIVIAVVTAIIVSVKPYPLDYVGGTLLVDPLEMQKGSFEASGTVIGVVIGWVLERRMVQFSTDASVIDLRGRLIRGVVGVVIVGVVYLVGNALFKAIFGLLMGKLIAMALLTFVAMFVVPYVFTWLEQTRFVPFSGAVPTMDSPSSSRSRGTDRGEGARSADDRRSPRRRNRESGRELSSTPRRSGSARRSRSERDADRDAWESAARAAGYDPEAEQAPLPVEAPASVEVSAPVEAVEPPATRARLSDLPSPLE